MAVFRRDANDQAHKARGARDGQILRGAGGHRNARASWLSERGFGRSPAQGTARAIRVRLERHLPLGRDWARPERSGGKTRGAQERRAVEAGEEKVRGGEFDMTKYMHDLFVSYTQAVANEAMISNDENASDKRWAEAMVRRRERRARLVDAIEKLEELAMPAEGRK